jgi:hypothetical protein
MSPHPQKPKQKFTIATLLWLMTLACILLALACGPLNRLQEFNRQNQKQLTGTTPASQNGNLNITDAYAKTQALPGYRFESRHIVQESAGHRIQQVIIGEYDIQGNAYILTQTPDDQESEVYLVDGNTYVYEPQYEGWVLSESQSVAEVSPIKLAPVQHLIQLTTQAGTAPVEMKQEILFNRPVTRYAIADTIQALGNELDHSAIDLRGILWIDDETGAVIKSETFLYENAGSLPTQEFVLAVSAIGDIEPITAPTPVIDPIAIAAATATAQVQLVLPAKLDYGGEPISFEIVPQRALQTPDPSPRRAEVQLVLRRLPGNLFLEPDLEPFLVQLRQQLTLSIPQRNLIVTSSGFELADSNAINRALNVSYFFNADLEDFNHVELILSGQGNPLFVPVPVER